jgi:hypothetical protein
VDVYLVRPESFLTSCSIVQGISDHHGITLEVEWEENFCVLHVENLISVYYKTDILGLQSLLWDKFGIWANNVNSVQGIWNNFKDIVFASIEHFVPHKILRKNPDPEYCRKELKRLKVKVRKAYNRRKLGSTT